ncbi:MAG: phosphoadenosine phosphosulfate reductase family protein [Desulfovibrionaceae bacterium]
MQSCDPRVDGGAAGASLEDRRATAHARFAAVCARHGDAARRGGVAVAWTGGKDSTLVLALWRQWLAAEGLAGDIPLVALSLDTGCKFPEVMVFRDQVAHEWGVALHVARPAVDVAAYPVAEDKVACCGDLKIAPLKAAVTALGIEVLFTGLRRDEHPSRAVRPWLESRLDPAYHMAHPILECTEMDVWAATMEAGLPYCGLYDAGYRSLGCMPCTTAPAGADGERAGRDQGKERKLALLHSLGYF